MQNPEHNQERVNIVALKWGNRYSADYVNRLASSVRRHLGRPHDFICFTDDPAGIDEGVRIFPIPEIDLPKPQMWGGWRKLCLFRPDLPIEGASLFLDLDIVVTGSLDALFDYEPDKIPIIHNWVQLHKAWMGKRPAVGNSSVFRFEANDCGFIWDQFHAEKEWALANFHPPQTYLTHCIRPKMIYWPESWVRSFKRHCSPIFPLNLFKTPRLPNDARIVAFHGRPDPDEALQGFRGTKLHHFTRPASWIAQHWH